MPRAVVLVFCLLLLASSGVGCLSFGSKPTNVPPLSEQPKTVEILGVVKSLDQENRRLTLGLASGGQEEVFVSESVEFPTVAVGALVHVFGTRDPASLEITARTIRVTEAPGIVVMTPEKDATVTSPLIMEGFAAVQENLLLAWRIRDAEGAEKLNGVIKTIESASGFQNFHADIFLPTLTDQHFSFEIFAYQPKTSSELFLQIVPLKLLTTKISTFDIFLPNRAMNPTNACDLTFPVSRTIAQTSALGRAALIELLKGPSVEEVKQGYEPGLSSHFTIQSLIISNEIATVDIPSSSIAGLGPCERESIHAQITNTLSELPGVTDVKIILDSNTTQEFIP